MAAYPGNYDRYALMALTSGCNQKCITCFEADTTYDVPDRDELRKIFDDLAQRGFSKIVFIGGEVTTTPDLEDHIAYITARGMGVNIATNGLRLDDRAYLERLIKAGLRHIEFSISSHIEEDAARITGRRDSLKRQLAALDNITALASICDPPLSFNTNTVITSINGGYLPELAEFILRYSRVNAMSFKFPTFEGRMLENLNYMIRYSELSDSLVAIKRMSDERGVRMILDGFPLCAIPSSLIHTTTCFIDMDSMLFGYNYSNRVKNKRFDLLPMEKSSAVCGKCVLSRLCIGFPKEYIEAFSAEELKPVVSYTDIERAERNEVIQCMNSRHAKNVVSADGAVISGCFEQGNYSALRGFISRADENGFSITEIDLTAVRDGDKILDFMHVAPASNTRIKLRMYARALADGGKIHAARRLNKNFEVEAVMHSAEAAIHNELSAGDYFKSDSIGIMMLAKVNIPVRVVIPVSERNAKTIEGLVHFSGMSGALGIKLICSGRDDNSSSSGDFIKYVDHALNVAAREYPGLEIELQSFPINDLKRWNYLYAAPVVNEKRR